MCLIVKQAKGVNKAKHLPQCSTISLPAALRPYWPTDSNLEILNGQNS
jgi:hypothetical protein